MSQMNAFNHKASQVLQRPPSLYMDTGTFYFEAAVQLWANNLISLPSVFSFAEMRKH